MKKLSLYGVLCLALYPVYVLAETVSNADWLKEAMDLFAGYGELGTLAIVYAVVQLLIKATKTPLLGSAFDKWTGTGKFLFTSISSIVVATLSLMVVDGFTFFQAVSTSAVFTAITDFGFQFYKRIFKKEE